MNDGRRSGQRRAPGSSRPTAARAPGPAAWLRSVGKEGPRGEPQKVSAVLSLDCRADHTGATILTEQPLRQGSVEVELTLDAEPARRIPGFAGTTGQLVLTVSLDSVLALLAGHQRATVDYQDGAGSSKTTAVAHPADRLGRSSSLHRCRSRSNTSR